MKQTMDTLRAIVLNISFNDWKFRLDRFLNENGEPLGQPYLQVLFMDKDRITGKMEMQRCRKHALSFHMTNSEVVRTAYLAVQQALMHEAQEAFLYKGVRIINPHMDYDELAEAIGTKKVGISLRTDNTPKDNVVQLRSIPPDTIDNLTIIRISDDEYNSHALINNIDDADESIAMGTLAELTEYRYKLLTMLRIFGRGNY